MPCLISQWSLHCCTHVGLVEQRSLPTLECGVLANSFLCSFFLHALHALAYSKHPLLLNLYPWATAGKVILPKNKKRTLSWKHLWLQLHRWLSHAQKCIYEHVRPLAQVWENRIMHLGCVWVWKRGCIACVCMFESEIVHLSYNVHVQVCVCLRMCVHTYLCTGIQTGRQNQA